MPSWKEKERRQYDKIKESNVERGMSEPRAKEVAGRTVNKQRRRKGKTPNQTTHGTGNPNLPLEERNKRELYNLAKDLNIAGRSSMSKNELLSAIRKRR